MILDNYTTFDELLSEVSGVYSKIACGNGKHVGLKFKTKNFPVSINEHEFNLMHDIIVKNNLKNGFELATGTGISTVALGVAMKKTGGVLLSMDSYFEEITQRPDNIFEDDKFDLTQAVDTPGYATIHNVLKHFAVETVVEQAVGWSPSGAVIALKTLNSPLDFVFLDCPKSAIEIERDISYISLFMGKKYIIFIHDVMGDDVYKQGLNNMMMKYLGSPLESIQVYFPGTPHEKPAPFPLHYINKGCELP